MSDELAELAELRHQIVRLKREIASVKTDALLAHTRLDRLQASHGALVKLYNGHVSARFCYPVTADPNEDDT
jgi:hypothetical protein